MGELRQLNDSLPSLRHPPQQKIGNLPHPAQPTVPTTSTQAPLEEATPSASASNKCQSTPDWQHVQRSATPHSFGTSRKLIWPDWLTCGDYINSTLRRGTLRLKKCL